MPSFTLKTPSTIKCVHILGSWDHYHRQVPLVKNEVAGNDFVWSSNFAFPFITLEPGKRYWYYYLLNGYQVFHDSTLPTVIEPTTGRAFNILDIPSEESTCNRTPRDKRFNIPTRRPFQISAPTPIHVPSRLSKIHYLINEAVDAVEDHTHRFNASAFSCVENSFSTDTSALESLFHSPTAPANTPANSLPRYSSPDLAAVSKHFALRGNDIEGHIGGVSYSTIEGLQCSRKNEND